MMRFAALFISLVMVSGCLSYNAATGRKEFIVFTSPMEVMMGQDIHQQMRGGMTFAADKAAQARLDRIGRRLSQVADRQDYQYVFYLVKQDEMNAFTIPGGHIYFYTGLYQKLLTDDEIAAVLAHEIGHCAARHVIKKYQAALGYDLVSTMLVNSLSSDVAARITRLGGDALMQLGSRAYSRQDEYEADRLAVKYMHLAGYDPSAIVTTFEILAKDGKGQENEWLLLRTHPDINDRIGAVKKEIELSRARY